MLKWTIDQDIILYQLHESFAPRYAELVQENKQYLSQWLNWPRVCHTTDDFKTFIQGSRYKYIDGDGLDCAIEYRGELVGNIGFNSIDHELKKAEIGYWLGQQYQGNGIITRVCRFLIAYAFETLNVEKVQIAVAEDNLPSRAVCERLGMTLEGIISHQEKVGDRILSHAIYATFSPSISPSNTTPST
ncbi:Putative ribosomal N-acetyltransferase YdaF [Vibrio ruber DSM 16370]|uniref:Putative ribosomal N-acetyltransferase YdaF n=1 Tax=Vibrio ruber (strain DSM 16370 / JCM 11486 / BCRC 17186 / CECT 7878 / LMG 23124 / VR1) TaxID=1123498 RepID=A0A1R4LQI3_VIBR1|nr:GNAT family protein [Vibrio ruber]SJN58850.1 Putative ribosomal N-acetyltransferase YdaF [Vibrio ruber DSM 16370]